MRCEECLPLVEDYFDGELDAQTTDSVAQHLDACASCASAYGKVEREQELYLRYECDAQASPSFWENVMSRAAQDTSARHSDSLARLRGWLQSRFANFSAPRFSSSLTALIVLIAIVITIIVMRYSNSNQKAADSASVSQTDGGRAPASLPTQSETVKPLDSATDSGTEQKESGVKEPPQLHGNGRKGDLLLAASRENVGRAYRRVPGAQSRKPTPDELVREAEQKYVAAIAMLSRDVSRRHSRLDPETAARFERTLAAVDRTIADTRRAARQHPGDPVAAQYMLTAYAKKVDVLREMASF